MERSQFEQELQAQGFSEMVQVTREPDGMLESHTHPFEAKALILGGEIRIVCGDDVCTYRAGDIFHLQANAPHVEYYGPAGVKYLVGRR